MYLNAKTSTYAWFYLVFVYKASGSVQQMSSPWPRIYQLNSRNFVILSDIRQNECDQIILDSVKKPIIIVFFHSV